MIGDLELKSAQLWAQTRLVYESHLRRKQSRELEKQGKGLSTRPPGWKISKTKLRERVESTARMVLGVNNNLRWDWDEATNAVPLLLITVHSSWYDGVWYSIFERGKTARGVGVMVARWIPNPEVRSSILLLLILFSLNGVTAFWFHGDRSQKLFTTTAGFEPTREFPNRFLVYHLNHSVR